MQRNTRQRHALAQLFERAERPLTAEEVLNIAKRTVPKLGIATVYRTIKLMIAANEVRSVEVLGETPRYESANKEHHHHFLCRTCETVYEAEGCEGERGVLTAPPGFRVEGHEVVLRGVCGTCVDGEETNNHAPRKPASKLKTKKAKKR
ncbi:MAG: Fur family transcriptional regulator [Planctomycetota bacterium]